MAALPRPAEISNGDKMDWKNLSLAGATSIEKPVGTYQIVGVPGLFGGAFWIRAWERKSDFVAYPSIRFKMTDGSVDGTCGLGGSESEAVQDAIVRVMELVGSRKEWQEEEIEWIGD
jgi:hypothetical protein